MYLYFITVFLHVYYTHFEFFMCIVYIVQARWILQLLKADQLPLKGLDIEFISFIKCILNYVFVFYIVKVYLYIILCILYNLDFTTPSKSGQAAAFKGLRHRSERARDCLIKTPPLSDTWWWWWWWRWWW